MVEEEFHKLAKKKILTLMPNHSWNIYILQYLSRYISSVLKFLKDFQFKVRHENCFLVCSAPFCFFTNFLHKSQHSILILNFDTFVKPDCRSYDQTRAAGWLAESWLRKIIWPQASYNWSQEIALNWLWYNFSFLTSR